MSLKKIKHALLRELGTHSNMQLFQKAKSHHAALAKHETAMSMLTLLASNARRHWEEKDQLVAVLLKESQHSVHPYWKALLTVAFYPMLSHLRGRITGNALPRDDLDQLVLTSFLEVIAIFPLDSKRDRICMYLRQMTQRRVFQKLHFEQTSQDVVRAADCKELERREVELANDIGKRAIDGEQHLRWPDTTSQKSWPPSEKEQSQLITFLLTNVSNDIEGDRLALVIATNIQGQKLSELVRRSYPDLSSGDSKKTYQRIKRRHSRTLVKLRELLIDVYCPQTPPLDALPLRNRIGFEERR
jgi:hypothetical protein